MNRPPPPPRRNTTVTAPRIVQPPVPLRTSPKNSPVAKRKHLSVGVSKLNRDFMNTLDQKLVMAPVPSDKLRSPSSTNSDPTKPLERAETFTSQASIQRSSVTSPGKIHRRTASVGANPKDKLKDKIIQPDEPVHSRSTSKDRKSIRSKSKTKLFEKFKIKEDKNTILSTSDEDIYFQTKREGVAFIKHNFAQLLFSTSLQIMGVNQKDIEEIQKYVAQNYDLEIQSRFTLHDDELFSKLQHNLTKVTNTQNKHEAAKRIQSLFRMYRVRRSIKPLLDNKDEYSRAMSYARNFRHFKEQERNYCSCLVNVVDKYLTPVRQRLMSGKELMKMEEISYVFSNLETILEAHQNILKNLNEIYKNDWPHVRRVGKVILESRKELSAYGVYVGNFANSQGFIARLRSDRNGRFNMWLQDVESKHETFEVLLAEPIHHISKMEGCLEAMAGYLPTGSEEREVIDAYTMIFETAKFVQEQLNKSENNAILMDIQRRIHHDKPLDIVKDDRKLIIESLFTVVGHKKSTLTFILFNDSIFVGKPLKNNQCRIKEMRSLEVVQFEKGTDTNFVIKTPTNVYKVSGRADECSKWTTFLSDYEESNKLNRTIGVHMSTILKREAPSQIPSIVTQCIERIRAFPKGTKTEGLFRISGEHNQIIALRDIFDRLPPESRDLKPYSIHAVAGILKMFLRELEEPLLPFSIYDKLVQIERAVGDGEINTEQMQVYKDALTTVGPNMPTLKYLMDFLIQEVSVHSDNNKMTPSNLAIVFGPTLMRPEVETMETTLNSPLVNHSVQRIIENFYTLLPK